MSTDSILFPLPSELESITTTTTEQFKPLTLSEWRKTVKIEAKKPETLVHEYRQKAQNALDDNNVEEAIKLYNKAIVLKPNDYSLYCCRSYCHELLNKFDSCLNDSQFAIKLMTEMTINAKDMETELEIRMKYHNKLAYVRKARALKALERFDDAIDAFVEAKSHAIHCLFIDNEIRDIKRNIISKMSYDIEDIEKVYDQFNKIEDVIKQLNKNKEMMISGISDDTNETNKNFNLMPTNPFRYCGLYINGLSPDCDESKFEEMLSDCGTILRCKLYPNDNHSRSVITFLEPHSVREAVKIVLSNKKTLTRDDSNLVIRYRHTWILNGSDPQLKFKGDEIAGECYRWRTKGCDDSACKLLHIPVCKHIDQLSGETDATPVRKRISISSVHMDQLSGETDVTPVRKRISISSVSSVFKRLGERKQNGLNIENGNNDDDNGDHDVIKSDILKIINTRKASELNGIVDDDSRKLDRKARFKFDAKEEEVVVKKRIKFDTTNRSLTSYDDLYDY